MGVVMIPVRFPEKDPKPPTLMEKVVSNLLLAFGLLLIITMMKMCVASHQAEKRMCADPQTRAEIEHCATRGKISAWWLLLLL